MPKPLHKFKNVEDYIKATPKIEKELKQKHKLSDKDVTNFKKKLAAADFLRKAYAAEVETSPKVVSHGEAIEVLTQKVKKLSKAQNEFNAKDNDLKRAAKVMKRYSDDANGDKRALKQNPEYQRIKGVLEKTTVEWSAARKQVQEWKQAQAKLKTAQDSFTKAKATAEKSLGVALGTDNQGLVLTMGGRETASMKIG